jgi:hypothetical protein
VIVECAAMRSPLEVGSRRGRGEFNTKTSAFPLRGFLKTARLHQFESHPLKAENHRQQFSDSRITDQNRTIRDADGSFTGYNQSAFAGINALFVLSIYQYLRHQYLIN